MKIISIRKNCMGTMSFTMSIGKMRKAEEFVTYPLSKFDDGITIRFQSNHRWAELNARSGEITMSARRDQYADSLWFCICKSRGTAETDLCQPEQLRTILDAIRGTASPKAGNNALHVYCDNSNADRV